MDHDAELMDTLYDRVRAECDALGANAERALIAEHVCSSFASAEALQLLRLLVADVVAGEQRARVRSIERTAQAEQVADEYAASAADYVARQEERRARWEAEPWLAPRQSRIYKAWAQDTDAGRRHERARREQAEFERTRQAEIDALGPGEWSRRRIAAAIETFRREVRLELTQELLASTFALGDGRRVSWGEASVEDHRTRIGLLMQTLEGTAATVQGHRAAITLLLDTDTACLNDTAAELGR